LCQFCVTYVTVCTPSIRMHGNNKRIEGMLAARRRQVLQPSRLRARSAVTGKALCGVTLRPVRFHRARSAPDKDQPRCPDECAQRVG